MNFEAQVVLAGRDDDSPNLGLHLFENMPREGETVVLTPDGYQSNYYTVTAIQHWPLPEKIPKSETFPELQRKRSSTVIYVKG